MRLEFLLIDLIMFQVKCHQQADVMSSHLLSFHTGPTYGASRMTCTLIFISSALIIGHSTRRGWVAGLQFYHMALCEYDHGTCGRPLDSVCMALRFLYGEPVNSAIALAKTRVSRVPPTFLWFSSSVTAFQENNIKIAMVLFNLRTIL